jgi:outer membrane immunogenic protein
MGADLGVTPLYKNPAPPVYVPEANSWTGMHVGVNAGYSTDDFVVSTPGPGTSTRANGFIGGFQVGYDYQINSFVIGLESDVDLTLQSATWPGAAGVTTKMPWFGTTRGRFGYTVTPNTLIYVTGGAAYTIADTTAGAVTLHTPGVGWTVGGGIQYQIANHLQLGLEYLHVDISGPSATLPGGTFGVSSVQDLGKMTIGYKF